MRGKSPAQLDAFRSHAEASMRPAHYAREVLVAVAADEPPADASMRPAHYAREVRQAVYPRGLQHLASMRPAHYAREVPPARPRSPL